MTKQEALKRLRDGSMYWVREGEEALMRWVQTGNVIDLDQAVRALQYEDAYDFLAGRVEDEVDDK